MNLFIIGNGFDRAHGLSTSYGDFRNYLENEDWEYLVSLEALYDCVPESNQALVEKRLWREFENNLSSINEDVVIDGCMSIEMGLESGDVGIEDTLNIYWEEQYGYIQKLNDYIKSWTEQIDIHVPKKTDKIRRNTDDLFISFNYTLLLEKIYRIRKNQILHIHGSIDKENNFPPVIGHGNSKKISDAKEQANKASEEFLEKECSIYNALANYYERTFKNVNKYLFLHRAFFEKLNLVDELFVIGHSFGDVDLPYFKKVLECIQENVFLNIYINFRRTKQLVSP
ncbi:MAG: bacteriophage abortive infection AbiH family protein [Bacillota bacterium]